MTEDKGLDPAIADKIGAYVNQKGGKDLLETLRANADLVANESAKAGLEDMEKLFNYLTIFGVMPKISFDMSLARGLDYYTGVIYEVVTEGSAPGSSKGDKGGKASKKAKSNKDKAEVNEDDDRSSDPSVGVGSVAAGGRYDNLVSMFSGGKQIPCVGISFGVERIFSITKARMEAAKTAAAVRSNEVDVFVMAFGGGLLQERMEICKLLWDAGVKAEFSWKEKPRMDKQFKEAEKSGIPFSVILGETELAQGKVKVKQNGLPADHPEKEGVMVDKGDLVADIRRRVASREADELAAATRALQI